MTRARAVNFVLLVCAAALGWHLVFQGPAASPAAAPAPAQTAGSTQPATTPATAAPTARPPSATTKPPEVPEAGADVPQDHGAVPAGTPGPDRRRVEAEEPSADQVTDAQLQSALDRQTADERRLEPTQERAAVAAAWKQVHPHISAARTWSHVKQRAAVGLLVNEGEAAQPVVVNVVTVWSGDDPQGVTEVHRAETRLTYRSSDNTWQPLS